MIPISTLAEALSLKVVPAEVVPVKLNGLIDSPYLIFLIAIMVVTKKNQPAQMPIK
jgi:hypothetical protein